MRSPIPAAVAMACLTLSAVAWAGPVVTPAGDTPAGGAPNGIPGQVPPMPSQTPSAGTAGAYTVPSVRQPTVQPAGTDGGNFAKKESSAEIWDKAIQAPPEGKISTRSKIAAERALMQAYEAGRLQSLPPIAGTNGEVLYAYGQSLPTLVTAPLHTSIIVLRDGMRGAKAVGLSPGYWQIEALMAGRQPEVAITPRFAGLHANLVVTGTSPSGKPMNYVIEVTSDANRYTPMIGFYYPDAIVRSWKEDAATQAAFAHKVSRETVAVLPSINPADLDFRWKIRCAGGGWFSHSDCGSITPERVFDDGKQTFIQFRPDQGDRGGIPSILAENAAGQNAIVNAAFRDGYYIVDGVPPRILLLAGKGGSGKVVKLLHEPGD
ncbi:TrbG/VirB9 family P-type conjugative transfer protein [Acidithiobacillus sp.]|uniref:TrbG/VirB9 family P-type conjugative transfer protein n=1 Tax=Acidithiobacillus sp. TaxID=1872118 RepID=UPI003D08758A